MHYLNGNGHLPTEQKMLQDTETDIGQRFALGWPKKKAHSVAGQFHREYFDDLANTANIPKIPEVFLKIYDDCGQRRSKDPIGYRNDNYRISGNGFDRTSSTSHVRYTEAIRQTNGNEEKKHNKGSSEH